MMLKKIPSVIVPIIKNSQTYNKNLNELLKNKKVIIFGVPGAFTPTCSEQHLPGFIKYSDNIKLKGIDEIYCMSVNDKYVMKSWFMTYKDCNKIMGIADGNGEISNCLGVISDKTSNFMGLRCTRFSMIVHDNIIKNSFFEDPGKFKNTSAEDMLKVL